MPLIIPDSFNVFRVVGIDPGLNNTGISVYHLEYGTSIIKRIEAFTLVNDKLPDFTGLDPEFISERTIKLYKLKYAIQHAISNIQPAAVACESPFYNRFRPMAYGALLEVLSVIHSSILEYNSNIPFVTVEPLLVKKTVGAGMQKGKIDVKLAIQQHPFIINNLVNDVDTLDEHSIDAIAVGFTYLKTRGI